MISLFATVEVEWRRGKAVASGHNPLGFVCSFGWQTAIGIGDWASLNGIANLKKASGSQKEVGIAHDVPLDSCDLSLMLRPPGGDFCRAKLASVDSG